MWEFASHLYPDHRAQMEGIRKAAMTLESRPRSTPKVGMSA